jgi:hypothetical protein
VRVRLIRNATLVVEPGGCRLLVDPCSIPRGRGRGLSAPEDGEVLEL